MANASFGVNILPKTNANVTIGNSDSPWTIVSPSLTGTPTAPTAAAGTNTTQIATTAFVQNASQIIEYEDKQHFPVTGEGGKVYIADDTNIIYRWDDTELDYVSISSSNASGTITVSGTITNVSGSYSGVFNDNRIVSGMKCTTLEVGTPGIFNGDIAVTSGNGTVTIACDEVSGTSTFTATFIASIMNSTEYDALDGVKADKVANAVNNSFAGLDTNGNLTNSCLSVSNGKLCITYKKEVTE